jgi:type II secretory pathway pseudopilin PulG
MVHLLKAKTGKKHERGFSVLEVMIASFIMLIGIGGLMALFVVAAAKNSGQGDQATRTTEYAQDKMEQLLALNYSDTTSQVVGSTTICATCTGYTSGVGLTAGGSVTPSAPVVSYVDYIDGNENITGSSTAAIYMREWSIVTDTAVVNGTARNIKTITVYVQANFSADVGANLASLAPNTTLIAVKEQY